MKFISSEFGQAVQLFVMEEVRPQMPVYPLDFWTAISSRYRFASGPSDVLESLKSGAKFNVGQAVIRGRHINITELGIYNDGMIVNAHHTEEADAVMTDFITWVIKDFGFREPQTQIPRRFASNIIVEFDDSLDFMIKGFSKIGRSASENIKVYGLNVNLHVTRISFGIDPSSTPAGVNTSLFIEPRANRPFSEHRYYCGGPLTTDGLAAWLQAFESASLSG